MCVASNREFTIMTMVKEKKKQQSYLITNWPMAIEHSRISYKRLDTAS